MQKVLITGFEPFGGERVNPSWEVVKQLNDMGIGWCAHYCAPTALRVRRGVGHAECRD